jgi:hypothetical protein
MVAARRIGVINEAGTAAEDVLSAVTWSLTRA